MILYLQRRGSVQVEPNIAILIYISAVQSIPHKLVFKLSVKISDSGYLSLVF